ncbi:hypothetical protein ACFYZJ_00500 [Streptomyces sp. NPDC001848]|uniref:hypothetical protein n=1 Tax=Streptomyces sp. NPDC001848 TaxID=3364618 RepID=UPI0036A3F275
MNSGATACPEWSSVKGSSRTPEHSRRHPPSAGRRPARGEDVFIGIVENGPQDWSFGFGRAQYTEGDLAVPGR